MKLEAYTNRVCEIPNYPRYQQCLWSVTDVTYMRIQNMGSFLSLFTGNRFHSVVRTRYAMNIHSHNHCWYGNATVPSLGTVDVRMSISKCNKYWNLCHGITVRRSLCGCASNVAVNKMKHSYALM
jgi:hypothetical protein